VALSGCLALLAPPGVGRKLATLRQAPALIRSPLRCSARPNGLRGACARSLALTLHTRAGVPQVLRRSSSSAKIQSIDCGCHAHQRPRRNQPSNRLRPNLMRFTTTAPFTNAGPQIRTAAFRTETPIQRKKPNGLFQLPFTPAGVKGRGEAGDKPKSHRENPRIKLDSCRIPRATKIQRVF